MSHSKLTQHLSDLDIGFTFNQLQAQLPDNLTLSLIDGVLCLYDKKTPITKLKVDFIKGSLFYRSQQHLGAENLIKACRIKGQNEVRLLDGTCGLGSDSFLLHQAGFDVFAVEKNIVIYTLLFDGVSRYQQHTGENCFQLMSGDTAAHLNKKYDVIYLDPMFPNKVKSAKNKKSMQLFQSIHKNEIDDAATLLDKAMSSPCKRVVIKRPVKSPLLTKSKPTFQIIGKICRFDAYQLS